MPRKKTIIKKENLKNLNKYYNYINNLLIIFKYFQILYPARSFFYYVVHTLKSANESTIDISGRYLYEIILFLFLFSSYVVII